jgi:hypothetical protein
VIGVGFALSESPSLHQRARSIRFITIESRFSSPGALKSCNSGIICSGRKLTALFRAG